MSQTLKITNFSESNINETTVLTADTPAGSGVLAVDNSVDFSGGVFVLVGGPGSKIAEIIQAATVELPNQIPLVSNTMLAHEQNESIVALFANQINIYVAANPPSNLQPPDSQFTLQATINIDANNETTSYTDVNGSGNFWYKSTYYNSSSTAETDIASSSAIRGNYTPNYCSITDIRKTAGMMANPYISDVDIDAKRTEAQNQIDGILNGMYTIPFQPPVDKMILGITRMLAAGMLMIDDPGAAGSGSAIYTEGKDKIADAEAMLAMVAARKYILTDAAGDQIISPSSSSSKSFPDATTTLESPGRMGGSFGSASHRNFRMSDVQGGYYGRRY
jgi:hypothetical protein